MTAARFMARLRAISDAMRLAHIAADETYRRDLAALMAESSALAMDEPEQYTAICRAEAERFLRLMGEYDRRTSQ